MGLCKFHRNQSKDVVEVNRVVSAPTAWTQFAHLASLASAVHSLLMRVRKRSYLLLSVSAPRMGATRGGRVNRRGDLQVGALLVAHGTFDCICEPSRPRPGIATVQNPQHC